MEEKNKEGLAMAQQLESVNERLRYFEKRFQQVASATGLTNPDEIINKFTLKEEIKHELNIEIQQKHNTIQQQTAKMADLRIELRSVRDNFVDSKWKDVDSLEEGVRDSDAKSEKNKSESERITQRLAYFREGLVSLISMLPDEILQNNTTQIEKTTHNTQDANLEHTTDILHTLDGRLDVLVHACEEGEMSRRQKEFELAQEKREREAATAARLAAEAAEKIKMTTLYNLTRRVSNDPHLMLSGPSGSGSGSSTTSHAHAHAHAHDVDVDVDGDGDGDIGAAAASGPSSRDSSTHASRTDLLHGDGNQDELARTVQRDAGANQAAAAAAATAQRQEDAYEAGATQQQQVAAF